MSSAVTWTIQDGSPRRVLLTGSFDERLDLGDLEQALAPGDVLDTSGISRINSSGVGLWTKFIRRASERVADLSFERCSVAFTQQLSMIASFTGTGRVVSVAAPYICTSCDLDTEVILNLEGDFLARATEPRACPECGGALEFDDLPEVYFAFARC